MKKKPCPKILFILKQRNVYDDKTLQGYSVSSGLFNSATFVSNMLKESGIECKLVEVVDSNQIDKEVHTYKPTLVIIEAIWVPPTKFNELCKLHSNVKWIIRVHSEVPFLSNEGMAFNWIKDYLKYANIFVSFNSKRTNKEFQQLYPVYKNKIIYLPNYYNLNINQNKWKGCSKDSIHIGCFGAIRPMKNQTLQAIAAIEFANQKNKTLYFHINVARIENKGENVIKNLRALFEGSKHRLVEHLWLSHSEFITLVQKMDICMQVSMSESFNIVSADAVNNEVPLVASTEVEYVFPLFKANPTNSDSIISKLKLAWWGKSFYLHNLNKIGLFLFSLKSKKIWINWVLKNF